MIQGDLNAKTGSLEDTITPDKSDELFELQIDRPPKKRNSRDSAVNPRGNELLDMCKSLDLNIINGRRTGDLFGDFTCFKWNGNSVVDYLLTSSSILQNVPLFRVWDFFPGSLITALFILRSKCRGVLVRRNRVLNPLGRKPLSSMCGRVKARKII